MFIGRKHGEVCLKTPCAPLAAALVLSCFASMVRAEASSDAIENRVTMDVYIRADSERCQDLATFTKSLARQRKGLDLVVHDVVDDLDARRRLYALGKEFRTEKLGLPAVHVMGQFQVGYSDTEEGRQAVESLLAIEVFTRQGCPHCRDAKAFLRELAPRWPALNFVIYDIVSDTSARNRMMQLAKGYGVTASSVPAFHLCRQLKVGYLGPATTGRELETIIRRAARPLAGLNQDSPKGLKSSIRTSLHLLLAPPLATIQPPGDSLNPSELAAGSEKTADGPDDIDEVPGMDELPELDDLPELDLADVASSAPALPSSTENNTDEMTVPVFGRLKAQKLGMPLFTLLVGLVDGFNPCAMWVLMFLLSVLVNIRERSKILIIAGTFVFVSGLAYFAFMAAWLNVFMLVGLDRPAQVILGSIAIVIGVINVKDFYAFGSGVSLKIPESAKPGIYARVRKIVAARHLYAALLGAIVLAVLVNMIELLCTAGLPAMYTQILTMQQYSPTVNYLYLGLYIVAYMLDDSLLVGVVVLTLSKKKLQEGEGRWLKLLSGVVILALGVIMIVKPDILV